MKPVYKRILLKLSGEVLAGGQGHGFDFDVINSICTAVKKVSDLGVEIGLVVGGGNFWRGRSGGSMDRTRADHIGMLATVMNSLALALEISILDVYTYYISKLSSFRRKSKRPIVSMPSSLRRGMMWSFTMITFLKESLMFVSERDSCISFSLSGIDNADCT